MYGEASRRTVSLGCLAAAVAAATWMRPATPQARITRYQDGLAARFKRGDAGLTTMALAHVGGFADRIPDWLGSAPHNDADAPGPKDLQRIFDALVSGNLATIEAALRDSDDAINMVDDALILLGHAALLPALHRNDLQRSSTARKFPFTVSAALGLAAADEWHHALAVLEQVGHIGGSIPIDIGFENLLWKYAYFYRRVDSAMPLLAAMPFEAARKHLVEYRRWKLAAYQIRAGMGHDRVPIMAGKQPIGYAEAAAMQIAALADDPSAADYIRDLRAIVKPRKVEIILASRGVTMSTTNVQVFSTAEAQLAARHKDYVRAAALARMPSQDILVDPPEVLIKAFLEEGDWRAAATIARDHDPRRKSAIPGFDDTRARDFVILNENLAIAAAWHGDDAAAAELLGDAEAVYRAEVSQHDDATRESLFRWLETVLAGLAEDRLPRKYLYVLMPTRAFHSLY